MPSPTRLSLETLCARLIPSVTTLNLTSDSATAVQDGFIVRQVDAQPTGTGYIRSFVRFQGASPGGGGEQGYNTDARPLQFDENKSPQFTRSITVGDVPVVTENGVRYREFLLDVNQKSSASRLTLDEVRIYLGDRPDLTGYDRDGRRLAGLDARFDLDAGGDVSVLLDARLNSGSGSGDMVLLVPDAAFKGATVDTFVYLYSKMGCQTGASANGGFEEWAVRGTGVAVAPPPAGAGGSSSGSAEARSSLSGRVFMDGTGQGIDGVFIHLSGRDADGNNVDLVTQTAPDGSYQFAGLLAGTYAIWEEQPEGYDDSLDFVGSIGGVEVGVRDGSDRIGYIFLDAGKDGIDYNFSEKETWHE